MEITIPITGDATIRLAQQAYLTCGLTEALIPRALRCTDTGELVLSLVPATVTGGNGSATTNADGTTYMALANQAAIRVIISNNSGADIEFLQGGSGTSFVIYSGTYMTINGITNSNQITIRRVDHSTEQVVLQYRWENQ